MSLKKIAILFSGEGSNLENIIKKLHQKTFENLSIEVVLTLTNNPNAKGIQRAKKYALDPVILDHTLYKTREEFDKELVKIIKRYHVDLVILAGFMRILTPIFTKSIKAINIHPSLLPNFKGANAIQRSFNSSIKQAGVSVHFVNEKVDDGEIILQSSFDKDGLDYQAFCTKIHQIEYDIFPKAIIKVLKDTSNTDK